MFTCFQRPTVLQNWSRTAQLALGVLPACVLASGVLPARAQTAAPNWQQSLSGEKKIAHVLNRLEFGPRPGDYERVQKMGIERWIDWQLAPEKIDDRAVNEKLSVLKTLKMSPEKLMLAQTSDMNILKKVLQNQQQKNTNPNSQNAASTAEMKMNARQRAVVEKVQAANFPPQISMQAVGELQLDKITRAVESNRQLYEIMVDFWGNHFNLDVKKNAVRTLIIVDEREVIRPHVFGKFRDMLGASAKSPAMLLYLDNASSSREIEMGEMRGNRRRRNQVVNANAPAAPVKKRGGINENYARELMELHTLGVDGGYSQQDVQEVARCFTGWSIERETGEFRFRPYMHDDGEKTVLGQRIPAGGGIKDGERVLDILAAHPSTAQFISRKLCTRLIADEPPQSAIDKAAKTFSQTGGDLRAVVKTIVTSSEFFSTAAYRAKIKSPFEYAVSSVRALDGVVLMGNGSTPEDRMRLVFDGASVVRLGKSGRYGRSNQKSMAMLIAEMGQPLFSYQAPTGYSEDSSKWVSTGALVARLNFALALVGGNVYNVLATPTLLLKNVDEHDRNAITEHLLRQLVGGDISSGTRSTLARETKSEGPIDRMKLTALILGSPEFQRR
jgi:uncharacterized protein (DUF1800 family)